MNKFTLFILALIFGIFGVHNFVLKQTKKGVMHLLLTIAGFFVMVGGSIYAFILELLTLGHFDTSILSTLIYVGAVIIGISFLWALYDGVMILLKKDEQTV